MADPRIADPAEVPDLRLRLWERWQPGALYDRVIAEVPLNRWTNKPRTSVDWERTTMERADLWWVSADMAKLATVAAETMPATTLTEDLAPSVYGFMVFEHPLDSVSAEGTPIVVDAVAWGPVNLPSVPAYGLDAQYGVGLSFYHWQDVEDHGGHWVPLGRTDWVVGMDHDRKVLGVEDDSEHASMVADRALLGALWLISRQKLAAKYHLTPGRPIRRRSERKGASSQVSILRLRQTERAPASGDGSSRGVEWSHRWLVRPHWRQQACGPGRSQRRPVLVAPHVKGPPDKELVVSPQVKALVR